MNFLGRAVGYLVLNAQQVVSGARQAVTALRSVVASSADLDQAIKSNQYGAIATSRAFQAMSVAVVGAFAAAIKTAVEWEDQMASVQRTTQVTDAELEGLSKGLLAIAQIKPIKPIELGKIAEEAGALGVAKRDVLDFTATVADLAAVSELTVDEASSGLARLTGIMGNTPDEFKLVSGAILELGRSTKATDAEILNMSRRIAGAGKVVGLTTDEVLGFAAAIASVGVREEQGGSGISRTFIDIQNAVNEGGAELETFAAVAGKNIADFSKLFREDAAEAVTLFVEGLGRSGQQAIQILNALGITEIRQRDVLLRLAAGTQNYADANVQLRNVLTTGAEAMKDQTLLADIAGKRYQTVASQLAILRNQIFAAGNAFGKMLLPALRAVTGFLQNVAAGLNNMSPASRTALMTVLALVGGLSALVVAILSATVAFAHMSNILTVAGGRLATFGGILKGVLGTLALTAVALGGFLAYQGLTNKKVDETTKAVKDQVKANKELVASITQGGDAAKGALDAMAAGIMATKGAGSIIKDLNLDADKIGLLISGGLPEYSQNVADALQNLRNEGKDGVEDFIDALVGAREEWKASALEAQVAKQTNDDYADSIGKTADELREMRKAEQEAWDATEARNQALIDIIDAQFAQRGAILSLADAQREYDKAIEDSTFHARELARAQEDVADAAEELPRRQRELADAERELSRARQNARDDVRDAVDELADAHDDEADAQDRVLDAERKLEKLRREDSVRILTTATNNLIRAQLGLLRANRDVADAEFYLNYIRERGGSARDIEDAELALSQTRLDQADAQDGVIDAEESLADARQRQLDLPREIAAAERDLQAARRDVAASAREIRQEEQELADARQALAEDRAYIEAQEDVADAQDGVRDAVRGYEDALRSLSDVQRENPAAEVAQAQLDLEQAYYDVARANTEVAKQMALANGQAFGAGEYARTLREELLKLSQDMNGEIATNFEQAGARLAGATPVGKRPENLSQTEAGDMAIPEISGLDDILDVGGLQTAIEDLGGELSELTAQGFADNFKTDFNSQMKGVFAIIAGQLLLGLLRAILPLLLTTFVLPFLSAIGYALVGAVGVMATIVGGLAVAIVALIVAGIVAILWKTGWAEDIWNAFFGALQAAWDALYDFGGWLYDQIMAALDDPGGWLTDVGGNIIDGLWQGIQDMWDILPLDDIGGWIWDNLVVPVLEMLGIRSPSTVFIGIGKDIIQGLWDGVKAVWDLYWRFWSTVGELIISIFADAGGWLIEKGKAIIQGLWDGILELWDGAGGVLEWLGGLGMRVAGLFATAGSWLWNAGKSIMEGLKNGVLSAARSVAEAILKPINWAIDNVINNFMRGIELLAGALGITIDLPEIGHIELPKQFHEGGVVGRDGQRRTRKRLRPDEEVAVLLKGERVLTRQEAQWYEKNDPNAIRYTGGINWPDIDVPNPLDAIDAVGDVLDSAIDAARRMLSNTVKPLINGAMSLMDGTVGQWGPMGEFLAGLMHKTKDLIFRWAEGAEDPGRGIAVETIPAGDIIRVGKEIAARGFSVGEHPSFGGVAPVHSRNSYHYRGRAIDVNWYPRDEEPGMLDWLEKWIKANVKGVKELLWREAGHFNHLHLAMASGGVTTGPVRALIGEAGPEAVIPLDRLFRELEEMIRKVMLTMNSNGLSNAELARYASLSTQMADVARLAYTAAGNSTRGGDDIDVNVHTDANAMEIASEIMWQKRVRLR